MDEQTREFLRIQFPEKQWSELQLAFEWVFEEGRFPVVAAKIEWEAENEKMNSVMAKLNESDPGKAAREVAAELHELPPAAKKYLEDVMDEDVEQLITSLADYIQKSSIWHKAHPRTGGTNPEADLIADAVKLAFEDLGVRTTYGNLPKPDPNTGRNIPSTRFGRVVEEALNFHGSPADWRKPTQRAVRGNSGAKP